MSEPMSEERERWIREYLAINPRQQHVARELMDEVDRPRDELRKCGELNRELVNENVELRSKLDTRAELINGLDAECDRLRAQLAEIVAVHARCPDYYVVGAGPRGVTEVFPEYEEGEWE